MSKKKLWRVDVEVHSRHTSQCFVRYVRAKDYDEADVLTDEYSANYKLKRGQWLQIDLSLTPVKRPSAINSESVINPEDENA